MQMIPLEQAERQLIQIIDQLSPGEEIILTRNNLPVARLTKAADEKAFPMAGRGKGMLTIHSEDDDHLKDFAEYMP